MYNNIRKQFANLNFSHHNTQQNGIYVLSTQLHVFQSTNNLMVMCYEIRKHKYNNISSYHHIQCEIRQFVLDYFMICSRSFSFHQYEL